MLGSNMSSLISFSLSFFLQWWELESVELKLFEVEVLELQLWHMVPIVERECLRLVPRLLLVVKAADKQLLLVVVHLVGYPTEYFSKKLKWTFIFSFHWVLPKEANCNWRWILGQKHFWPFVVHVNQPSSRPRLMYKCKITLLLWLLRNQF